MAPETWALHPAITVRHHWPELSPVQTFRSVSYLGSFAVRYKSLEILRRDERLLVCPKDVKSLGLLEEIIQFPASLAPEQLHLVVILIRVFAAHNYQFLFFPPSRTPMAAI